jgi:hypothetical protein
MNKSTSIANLAAAMAKAQAEMHNPRLDSTNPHFKSKFASLAAVREAVIPVLAKHGLSLTQFPVTHEGTAGCINHLAHESGEWMEETFLLPVDKSNAHGYASALTYAKRLSMQSVVGVVGDEDDDGNAAADGVKPVPNEVMGKLASRIQNATSSEELAGIWKDAVAVCKQHNDHSAHAVIKKLVSEASNAMKVAA